jgi:hypothetical protein
MSSSAVATCHKRGFNGFFGECLSWNSIRGKSIRRGIRVNKISANSKAIGNPMARYGRNIPKEPWTPAEIAGRRELASPAGRDRPDPPLPAF